MQHDTAGDPMTGLKWTRRTTAKIAVELSCVGIEISDRTVARLLKKMRFSLRVNKKKLSGASPDERDSQFAHIAELRESFAAEGLPVISVDTKKRELVGPFKNGGVAWGRQPVPVNDHDFRSDAIGIAIPLATASFIGAENPPTFSKDVAPILYDNCVTCHRPGRIAPMSLVSYGEVRPWAAAIERSIVSRDMPPWRADPSSSQEFATNPSLSQEDIDTIVAWVKAGSPKGDDRDIPELPAFASDPR